MQQGTVRWRVMLNVAQAMQQTALNIQKKCTRKQTAAQARHALARIPTNAYQSCSLENQTVSAYLGYVQLDVRCCWQLLWLAAQLQNDQ
jgi:hypothetical protein